MIRLPVHDISSSLALYIDHKILSVGQAYTNHSSEFYRLNDKTFSSNSVYASPYKQFVYDYAVSGAQVPSGVYVNGNFINKGTTGLKIDYLNGRAIFNQNNNGFTVSGDYAVKDFNIYVNPVSNQELLFESKFELRPTFPQSLTGLNSNQAVAPAIFIENLSSSSEDLAFGGLDKCYYNYSCMILADSNYQLEGVANILMDLKRKHFCVLDETPINRFGDFKSGNYHYWDYVAAHSQYQAFISDVDFFKVIANTDNNILKKYKDLRLGYCEFEIEVHRYT